MSSKPLAVASSTTAVLPPSIRPYEACTGSPSGPSTLTHWNVPWWAVTSASTVPSPPSATGTSTICASGSASSTPRPMARAACVAERLPLNEFGATTIFSATSLVNGNGPVLVLRRLAAHGAEVDALQLLGEFAHAAVADGPSVHLDHRRDLRARAAQQELLARVELGAVDAALDHGLAELFADHAHDQLARHALEDVIGDGRRDEDAVLVHEEVLGRALRHVPVDGQHYRLVVACLDRFCFGERRLRVRACHLRARRKRLVRNAPPAAHHAADARLDLDVVAERDRVDEEAVLQVVEAHADVFARGVQQRADIRVRLELVAPKKLDRYVDQLLGRVRQRHAQHVCVATHAVVVSGRLQEMQLLVPRVPVRADSLEASCAVMQRVGHEPELGVVIPGELALEVD